MKLGVGRGYWALSGVQGTSRPLHIPLGPCPVVAAPNVIANFRQM